MSGLSHGVVRVDQENSLTSLTLQDCGQVLPGATLIVIKVESPQPVICKTDEVGEICMASAASGSSYWGLPGLTNTTFKLRVNESSTAESQSTVSQKTFKNVQFQCALKYMKKFVKSLFTKKILQKRTI